MPGVGVGRVLSDEWNIPDKHIGQYRYTHKTRPYVIEMRGYELTLMNYTTGDFVTTDKETEFEVLQALTKMSAFPRAVVNQEIEL